MKGLVFNIQRFCLHDGPGIRTTVFLKGCPLRCLWCHNPESQCPRPEMFVSSACVGCGKCKVFCEKAFTNHCTACGKCLSVCPENARQIMGKERTAEEVFSVIAKDRAYYFESGGGVTLSGGEPFLQADFCLEILKKCKENGIPTCMETAGAVPWNPIEKCLPYVDLFLYDIKAIEGERHFFLTGADNALILENAKKLMASGKEILFRTPVIFGYNDDQIPKIASFVQGFCYELMRYNNLGKGKYISLGRKYFEEKGSFSDAEMANLALQNHAFYHKKGV